MSTLKPASSFLSTAQVNFPALKALWHMDDVVAGDTVWRDRILGMTNTFSVALKKDSEGVYVASATTQTAGGTPPTLKNAVTNTHGYIVAVSIAKTQTGSATGGTLASIGDTGSGSGPGVNASGAISDTNENASAPSLSGNPTTTNKQSCRIGYADCVDTTSPAVHNVLANNTDQVIGESSGSTTTVSTTQLALMATTPIDLSIISFAGVASNGSRQVLFAVFVFKDPLTLNELKLAAAEMARTGELYAHWRNRT